MTGYKDTEFRDDTSQIYPHPQSRLIRHDLCAQLAALDRYGLAEFSSALVDGLLALATWLKAALRATHRSSSDCRGRTASGVSSAFRSVRR
jgi:hypothetical protein